MLQLAQATQAVHKAIWLILCPFLLRSTVLRHQHILLLFAPTFGVVGELAGKKLYGRALRR